MRSPLVVLALLGIAACVGPGTYTVVPATRPTPAPAPAPVQSLRPLEITIVRPEAGKLLVQTNRAAYVAVFEIVPERGVALIYPTTARQQSSRVAGLSWLAMGAPMAPVSNNRGRYGRDDDRMRQVYALASDRPLRLSEEAYDPAYLQRVLGPAAYRASNPATTTRALARQFLRVMPPEEWGEDMYALEVPTGRVPYRIVRVSCPDGSIYEVREEVAARMRCVNRGPVIGNPIPPRVADVPERQPVRVDTSRRNPRIPIFGGTLRGPNRDSTRTGVDVSNDGDGRDPRQQGEQKPKTEPYTQRPGNQPEQKPDVKQKDEREAKEEKRDDKREAKEEKRDDKREAKEEKRDDQREAKEEKRDDKREAKEEKRDDQREAKEEKREVKEEKHEVKEEKHEDKREAVEDKRDDKREVKEEKREDKREVKEEKHDDKREVKEEKADDKREVKDEKREEKADEKADDKRDPKGKRPDKGKPRPPEPLDRN